MLARRYDRLASTAEKQFSVIELERRAGSLKNGARSRPPSAELRFHGEVSRPVSTWSEASSKRRSRVEEKATFLRERPDLTKRAEEWAADRGRELDTHLVEKAQRVQIMRQQERAYLQERAQSRHQLEAAAGVHRAARRMEVWKADLTSRPDWRPASALSAVKK